MDEEVRTPEEPRTRGSAFRKSVKYWVTLGVIPLVVLVGFLAFRDRLYLWISFAVVILSMIPFFLSFEKRRISTARLVLLSVLVALSVLGRYLFSFVPAFKPVTALAILTGAYLGMECGFVCGSMSALLSNIIFGQGPWTPFQMFTWGLLGFLAGLLAPLFRKHHWTLWVYGAFAGLLYSMVMDIWTVMETDGAFSWAGYWTYQAAAVPVTLIMIGSNFIFLLLLSKPIGKNLERLCTKYGI
ncbi:MAG: ECF transporter S component [Clostridia bacterium]|nr:ECF transporter S component [Clostridia bacterium]